MKRIVAAIISAVTTIISITSCSNSSDITDISGASPFGNSDILTVVEKADIELAGDDYIIQSFPDEIKISDITFNATFINTESFDENGCSINKGFGYYFEDKKDTNEYYSYVSSEICDAQLINECTVWFEQDCSNSFKQDFIEIINQFDPEMTYISKPYLTERQSKYEIPAHTVINHK